MATVAEVLARYRADTTDYVRNVSRAADATRQFADSIPQAEQAQDGLKTSSIALGAAMGTLGAQVFAKAAGAVKNFAIQGIQAAAQYEQTVISMEGIFQGSGMSMQDAALKTKTYLSELRDFAAKTPFELPQTLDAVKRLLSIGYAADDVKNRLLPTIGDMVAALGQPPQAISAVVYAFGQMKSAGRVLSQDLMQIGNALPGFNAKMAIATEMFGGDFQAMTKAMESGSLDSSTAIDVLIKAMQKFPGAAGAMTRQSESLNGVISTFKDTVNNALIDGIMPAIPALSGALQGLIPTVQSLATSFGSNLGPILTQGVEVMQAFAPIVSAVIPPLLELTSATGGLVTILNALAPVAVAVGNVLGWIATAFGALPPPIQNAIGVMIAFKVLLARLPVDSEALANGLRAAMVSIKASVVGTMDTIRLNMWYAGTTMKGLAVNARLAGVGFIGSLRAMGVAAKSFLLGIGPIGWALAAASIAMEIFASRSNDGNEELNSFAGTLTFVNGLLDENSNAMLAQKLAQEGVLESLKAAGISTSEYIAAIQAGGPALDDMIARLNEAAAGQTHMVAAGRGGMISVMSEQGAALKTAADKATEYATALETTRQQQTDAAEAAAGVGDALSASSNGTALFGRAAVEAAQRSKLLQDAQAAITDAAKQFNIAFEAMNGLLGETDARIAAKNSIADLTDALGKNGKSLNESTQKGRDNISAVNGSIRAWMSYAEKIQDPVQRQQALTTGLEKIRKTLEKQGLSNAQINKILKPYQDQADELKKMVERSEDATAKAKQAGQDVGEGLTAGLIESMKKGESPVNAAGVALGSAAAAGVAAGAQTKSPSRLTLKTGRFVAEGMTVGLLDGQGKAESTARTFGQSVANALSNAAEAAMSGSGSMSGALDKMFGSLPSPKSALEQALGSGKSLEKFSKDNEKDLTTLGSAMTRFDTFAGKIKEIDDKLKETKGNRESFITYFKGRFGSPSEFDELKKSVAAGTASIEDILGNYDRLREAIDQSFENRGNDNGKDRLVEMLEDSTRKLVQLAKQREKILERLAKAREAIDAAKESQQAFNDLLSNPLGEPNQIQSALNASEVTVDKVISTFQSIRSALQSRMKAEASYDYAKGTYDSLDKAMAARKGKYDERVAAIEGMSKRLVQLTKQRDEIAKKLAEGQAKLDDLISKRSDMIKNLNDSLMGIVKVDSNIKSADEFAMGLRQRVDALRTFITNIKALQDRGVDKSIVDQLVGMGAEQGGALAASLAKSSDVQIAEINSMQAEALGLSNQYATQQADQMYGAAITQAQAYVTGLQSQQAAVMAEMQSIADGINNYMAQIAADTGAGSVQAGELLAAGLQSQYEGITTEMSTITQGMYDTLFPLIDKSFDIGQDMMIRFRKGFREQAQAAMRDAEQAANRILEAMSKATGKDYGRISIDKSFGEIKRAVAPKYDRALFEAAAYTPGQKKGSGDLIVESGGISIQIQGGANMTPEQLRASTEKAVRDALAAAAKQTTSARR